MNAVIGSIIENLRQIKIIYEPTEQVFKSDRTNTGDAKEQTIQQFVLSYLTSDHIAKKGVIYNSTTQTHNIDCVILAPNHPKLISPVRDVIIAEGVYCAIEVKPDISTLTDKSELFRGLLQIQSVKSLDRKVKTLNPEKKPSYFDRIPAVIFSYKSANIQQTVNFMHSQISNGILTKEELPDLIVTLDNGVLFYCPFIRHSIFSPLLNIQFSEFPDEVFIHFQSNDHLTLAWFITILLSFTPPSPFLARPILLDYLWNYLVKTKVQYFSFPGTKLVVHNPHP